MTTLTLLTPLAHSQELQVLVRNSDQLDEVRCTTEEPPRKKLRVHELLSDSEDESLTDPSFALHGNSCRTIQRQVEENLDRLLQRLKLQIDNYPYEPISY